MRALREGQELELGWAVKVDVEASLFVEISRMSPRMETVGEKRGLER